MPVRYDPHDRSKMALDEQAAEAARTGAPTDAELQDLSDRWGAAMAKARACMDAHNDATAAGDTKEAQRQLAAGAIANAEQVQLGEQYKRLRRQRPDWEPATT